MTANNQQKQQPPRLNEQQNYGKIDNKPLDDKRKVEIFSQLVRHLTAIVYLVAELVLGRKPEKL